MKDSTEVYCMPCDWSLCSASSGGSFFIYAIDTMYMASLEAAVDYCTIFSDYVIFLIYISMSATSVLPVPVL